MDLLNEQAHLEILTAETRGTGKGHQRIGGRILEGEKEKNNGEREILKGDNAIVLGEETENA